MSGGGVLGSISYGGWTPPGVCCLSGGMCFAHIRWRGSKRRTSGTFGRGNLLFFIVCFAHIRWRGSKRRTSGTFGRGNLLFYYGEFVFLALKSNSGRNTCKFGAVRFHFPFASSPFWL